MPDILTPVAGIIDTLRSDAERSAQFLREHLYPFYLAIGRACSFAVRYNTNSDGLCAAEPALIRSGRQLLLPFFSRLDISVGASFAVAYTEMEIHTSGISKALIRS